MRLCHLLLLLSAVLALPAQGQVVITEIMYNPASFEGNVGDKDKPNQTEWVEIYNLGVEEVPLDGWFLQDEDGKTVGLPASTKIKPGEAIVLIPGVQTAKDFQEAWGEGYQVFPLKGWHEGKDPMSNLANSPSSTNEILTLRNKAGDVIDEVNYDDADGWPSDSPQGPSIVLTPDKLDPSDNDSGSSWVRSEKGKLGGKHAKKTEEYRDADVGSPGVVATEYDKEE